MVHTISTSSQSDELSYVQRRWSELLVPDDDLKTKLDRLFASETSEFGMETAYLSRIDLNAGTQHFEVVGGPHRDMANTAIDLSNSFCHETITTADGTLAISDAREEGYADHPAHRKFGLASYLGTTVTADGELYGTLCFADTEPRVTPITEPEVTLVEMYGQWATYELNQWTGPPTHDADDGVLDESDVLPPEQIDGMLDALGKQTRRVVLVQLLDAPEVDVDTLAELLDGEHVDAQLYHSHLPKLEAAGYVEWDRDIGVVVTGPRFSEVEPLVRLLAEYTQ